MAMPMAMGMCMLFIVNKIYMHAYILVYVYVCPLGWGESLKNSFNFLQDSRISIHIVGY